MKITGPYFKDDNFITVFVDSEEAIYTLPTRASGYGKVTVGSETWMGVKLTKELYAEYKAKATKVGTFNLD